MGHSATDWCSHEAGAQEPPRLSPLPSQGHTWLFSSPELESRREETTLPLFPPSLPKQNQTISKKKKVFLNFCPDSARWAKHQRQQRMWEEGPVLAFPPDPREEGPRRRGTLTPGAAGHSGCRHSNGLSGPG